jgi:NAD(P)-dependent dehydrogenase (short-subunit alcohol dehydrogenase family)
LISFEGRSVIVTGGAAGIGKAAAGSFAALGATVLVVDVSPDAEVVAEALGGSSFAVHADVTRPADVAAMVEACLERCGRVDVLVNVAGGFPRRTATWELADEDWDAVVDLNLRSVFLCSKAVLPEMIRRRSGRIVNVSSGAGRTTTHVTGAHYAAAKAGVLGFTRHLAREVGEHGITVNAVAPGVTLTPRIDRLYQETRKRELAAMVPLGRLSTPEEQAGPIVFLASDAAAYITGATLDVNGGRYMI